MSISVGEKTAEKMIYGILKIASIIALTIILFAIFYSSGIIRILCFIWLGLALLGTGLFFLISKKNRSKLSDLNQTISELREENRKLNWELNKAIFEILALFEFTNILGDDSEFDPMMELMVDTIKRILDYDGCCLFLYDEIQNQMYVKVNRGFPAELNHQLIPADKFLTGQVMKSGQALLINDLAQEETKLNLGAYHHWIEDFRSFIAVPLLFQNKTLGVLLIAKIAPASLTQEDLRLLFVIANQAALAIQNMRLYEKAYYSSITDGLTGVYNHKYFREQLEDQLFKAKEQNYNLSLALLDIDNFKTFNDTYGHQVGDMVLKEVSQLIHISVPSDIMIFRYGGEEFVVLMPGLGIEEAKQIAEKIRVTISEYTFVTKENQFLKVTVSLGIATFPDHIKNKDRMVEELIDKADESLYEAKKSGRNQVCYVRELVSKT